MAVSMTSTHLHACQHHTTRGPNNTRMPITSTLQQQQQVNVAGNTSIPPPIPPSSGGVHVQPLPLSHHQHYNPTMNGVNSALTHQPMMSIPPPPGPPAAPPLHSAPPPLPPPPLPPGVPPPLLGMGNIAQGGKIVHHGHQNHRMTGHHRHSSHQPRSSSHQRSSNSSSSSASAATRNNSFEPGYYRAKNNSASNTTSKSSSVSSKKKTGNQPGGQNTPFTSKFSNQHGNTNLRAPPSTTNKQHTTHSNLNGALISKETSNSMIPKGNLSSMKSHNNPQYVVVQHHAQNIVDHRHNSKQPIRYSNGKDKVRSNAGNITMSVPGNTTMPLVSVSAATVSHQHGAIHPITPQVNQHQTMPQNLAAGPRTFSDPHINDSNNHGVPIIPVVSAAPLPPEKGSPISFQPTQSLVAPATISVSACPPVSVSVAAMNSNGVLEFSHVQEPPFINNQVPLENYKTGTIASLVTSQNMTTKGTGNIPVRETKEKTPMCLINELARFNKMQHQYRLTDESGPAHKKSFTVCLKLGDVEEYVASGPSIKKAQHAAAAIALEKTSLKHPPPKTKATKSVVVTPTVELNALAMKRGEPTVYSFLTGPNSTTSSTQSTITSSNGGNVQQDQQKLQNGDSSNPMIVGVSQNGNSKSISQLYNQKYTSRWSKGSAPRPASTPSFVVSLKVGVKEFVGEGSTAQAAKHAAAAKALQMLKSEKCDEVKPVKSTLNPASVPFVPGTIAACKIGGESTICPVIKYNEKDASNTTAANSSVSGSDSTISNSKNPGSVSQCANIGKNGVPSSSSADISNGSQTDYDDLKSPISLVHESALKRNHTVHFDIVRETGPPHMRIFITKCIMGEFETQGEGNGKKTSKKRAAEMMVDKLKTLPPIASCHFPAPKKKAQNVANKKKSRNLIKIEQKSNPEYGQNINPISRLIQIQQAKKEKEPVYTLIAERGMPRRREFVMQVNAAGETAQGTGPNKKLAKRAAAESLLQTLGYFRPSAQPGKPALKNASSVNVASSNSSSTATGAGDNGNHLNSVDKPSKDSTEGKTSPSVTIPNGEKPKKLTFVDDLLPEKKQQPSVSHSTTNPPTTTSTSRTNYSGASSSTNNVSVMSKPLSKMNTTSNILQQPSNLAGNRNPVDVTNNTRKSTSGNSHTENELKPILHEGNLSQNTSSSQVSSNYTSSGMSSSSSVSSSSSSPLPTTKTLSNNRTKNEKKENLSKSEITSSSIKASSNAGVENKKSSPLNINQDNAKTKDMPRTKKSEEKKKEVVNCNGNTGNSKNTYRKKNYDEQKETDSDTLSNVSCKTSNSSGGSAKKPPTAKEELDYLASVLDFSVTYTNFPQKNKPDIVTLVKLTTRPPKVCHGSGKTAEESQNDAASKALILIADTGLENGNGIDENDGATEESVVATTPNSSKSVKSKTSSNS